MPSHKRQPIFDTVAVVGVGLIGGSLGMAAKKNSLASRVIGIGRSEQKLMRAKILGAIDDYSLDFATGASEADLVIICTPVRMVVPTLERMVEGLKQGSVVTDVGSTKLEIVEQATALVPSGITFVGGHPMAGSEESGVEAAFPDMFLGATYVLTPTDNTDLEALRKMTEFVEGVGARVEVMSPEEHDAAVAVISHLPHAISAALLHLAAQPSTSSEGRHGRTSKALRLAAGSFRDLTRISDSPPEIWRDICITNAEPIRNAIDEFENHLESIKSALSSGDAEAVMRFFEEAREIRQAYLRLMK
ncbi:MAG: prephenate dehydrogenase [Armatimonadetes bacterium]|nr:prephenate dehydrogenase [Armatimonadota bacterium]